MPSFFISATPRTSTFTPSFASPLARRPNSTGDNTLGGSLTRSRAKNIAVGDGVVFAPGALRRRGWSLARADRDVRQRGLVIVALLRPVMVERVAP